MQPMTKRIMGAGLPIAVMAAVASAVPWAVKRRMRPPVREMPYTPGHLGLAGTEVWLDGSRDTSLHGWWIPVAHTAPAVVVLHGWGANASLMLPLARSLHSAGFHTFFLDARGHGFSDADDYASMPRFAEDLDVAIDWVKDRHRVATLGVIGHSIGAGAAAITVSRRDDIGAYVSVSGAADVWEVMIEHTSLGRMPTVASWVLQKATEHVVGTRFDAVAPSQTVQTIDTPTMFVHGEDDEIVPLDHVYRLVEARGESELIVIPEGRHGDLSMFEPHMGPLLSFLSEHLR